MSTKFGFCEFYARFITLHVLLDGLELMIMITATFGQTIAAPSFGVSIVGALIVWRFIVRERRIPTFCMY